MRSNPHNSTAVQRLKEGGGGKKAAQHLAQVEQEVSNLKAAHGFKTMPAQVANMVVMISAIYILSTIFDGVVVARLPFEPVDTLGIRGFFHRGLKGEDYYEAGYLGFYILGNMLSRFAITKVAPNLSGAPKSVTAAAGNPFAALAEQWKENMEKVNAKYE